ncbi:MAG: PACE efflux transporter [Colwellia sp.]|jgi:Predicted membrane protein
MTKRERVFHSLLFEVIAIGMLTLFLVNSFSQGSGEAGLLAVSTSTIAMIWNYFYNLIFDAKFGHERIGRNFNVRCLHAVGFEIGIIILTIPLIMWALDLDVISVIILDLGLMVFFLVYSLGFNYLYDHIRHKIAKRP